MKGYMAARREGLALAALVVAADLVSKALVLGHGHALPWWVVENWVALVRWQNRGMSFSLFETAVWGPVLLAVLAVAASAVFVHWLGRMQGRAWGVAGLGLLLGGSLGNLIDRMAHGAVTDFMLLCWPGFACFYAFNVADAAITLGVVCLLWDSWREP
jgi:signal peptidase II